MSKLTVAVIGDFMNDVYHVGEASGLSAEVPIPIVKVNNQFNFPGGAGNVAANLEALGCETLSCRTFARGGEWGLFSSIPQKHRLMVGDHQVARWDENDYCAPWRGELTREYANQINLIDAIVVADYGKGAVTADLPKKLMNYEVPIFVDTKRDPSVWSGVATVVFPNTNEYKQYSEQYQTFDGLVCWKRGEMGLALYRDMRARYDPKLILSPSQARFVRSVNGAGDSVIAAFVYKYLLEESIINKDENFKQVKWQNCLDFANAAASVAVEHPYTYAPTLKEVEERYYQ